VVKTVDFIFDLGSPNAYLAYPVLKQIAARQKAEVRIVPALLGGIFKATGNQAPMLAFGNIRGKMAYERLEIQRFITKYGLTKFTMNPHFPVNSLLAMRGLVASGTDPAYVDAVLTGFWERGLKMDDPAVLQAVLDDAGLDGTALLAATQDPAIKQQLADNTSEVVERGVFGIPTFFVGPEMFFGKDRLAQVEEKLAEI
jgi:2-hydroxychromene-2-carboxylate isomerase